MQQKCKKMFGLDRELSGGEINYISKWVSEFSMSEAMIRNAYEKTVNNTGKISMPYMNTILKSWHEKGIKTVSQIAQLDSPSAFQPVPYITTYGATKAFVLSYSRAMNQELKPRGIRMMAMNPGWVKTEFFNHAMATNDGEVKYFNRLYEAKDVVATGLKDLYKTRKDVSIHGLPVRNQVRLVKLLPHSLVMKTWMNQQKKAKNNKNLTTK